MNFSVIQDSTMQGDKPVNLIHHIRGMRVINVSFTDYYQALRYLQVVAEGIGSKDTYIETRIVDESK